MDSIDKDVVPRWAIEMAVKKAAEDAGYTISARWENMGPFGRSLARYIAAHEQPPVDPLEQAVDDGWALLPPEWSREIFVKSITNSLRARGVTLKEGDA